MKTEKYKPESQKMIRLHDSQHNRDSDENIGTVH